MAWTDAVRAFFDQFHSDPAYRDRSWTEVEPEFRSGWMTHYPDRSWDEVAPEFRAHWEGSRTAGYTGTTGFAEGGRTVRLREEELQAHKREVPAGEVQVRKEVVTENRTIEVPVTREEAVIERHPVDRRPADRPIGEGAGETVRVPLKEEEVRVEKRPVVTGEVTVGKRPVQETQQVSGTVRREEARVDHEGDVNVARAGTTGYGTGYSGSRYGEATSTGMGAFSSGQFTQGMEVYGSDDDSVGYVKEVRGSDFLVDRSMQRDIYVPFSAVSNVTGSRVVLTLPAGDVDDQGWETPPLMGSTAA